MPLDTDVHAEFIFYESHSIVDDDNNKCVMTPFLRCVLLLSILKSFYNQGEFLLCLHVYPFHTCLLGDGLRW